MFNQQRMRMKKLGEKKVRHHGRGHAAVPFT